MQYSVVNYKTVLEDNELFRIDADFFRTDYLNSENKIKSHNWNYLGNLAKQIINFGAYSLTNQIEYLDDGVPFLNVGDIKDSEINFENAKKIDRELSKNVLKKSLCKENQVLLTIAGTIGNAAVAYQLPKDTNSNQAIANIMPDEISPFYLSVYLNSFYGKQQTARLTISSVQPNLLLTQVKKIKVFVPNNKFQEIIEKLYKQDYQIKNQSKSLYSRAEQLLLSELGLLSWKQKHELAFVKNFSDSQKAERFDAEYFQPKYEEIIEAVKKYKGGFVELGEVAKTKRGSLISDNFYNEKNGTPYIRGADFSSGFLSDNKLVYIDKTFKVNNETKVKKGNIVFALIGTVGSMALVDENFDGAFISNNLGKITTKNYNSIVLQVFLHSIVGKLYFEKEQTQTAQPKISDKDIHKFVLPKLGDKTEKEIERNYLESQKTKKISKSMLEIAKRGIEMAIEKDEQEAEEWINGKLSNLEIKL